MEQPEGFVALGQENKVCKLIKSLYGLKQTPKQWHQKFYQAMLESGFKTSECDKCVYMKDTTHGYVILCLYVDDMLIVGSDDKMIRSTKDMLKSKFDMKDIGLADVILGVKITRTQNGLVLNQTHYVEKILEKLNEGDTSIARTPIDTSQHLSKNRGDSVAQVEYSRIIGILMYPMSYTRHDLAYAVSRLSRYTSNPSFEHWKSITRLLRYLRYTREYGLHYGRYLIVIEGYNDANWISDIKDSRSTSGYVFTLGGAAISWKSSKQTVIARSTMNLNLSPWINVVKRQSGYVSSWKIFPDGLSRQVVISGSTPGHAVVPREQTANLFKQYLTSSLTSRQSSSLTSRQSFSSSCFYLQ
ncbi:hypothetical protein L6452_31831 [Arctium lappa]|uniref:Uncharacterized protein n=1 Tax=Arctium lappa TaxID=4217 RepID=A0ACB8Z418_ARCLA|nr:hypothetical protein L6452_31831 [Arctium lappa]